MSSDPSSSDTGIATFPGSDELKPLINACTCGSEAFTLVSFYGFNCRQCNRCGTAHRWLLFSADVLERYYDGAYHEDLDRHADQVPYAERYETDLVAARVRLQEYSDRIGRELGGLFRILDVGCGNCAFVDAARDLGIRADGIDPDPQTSHTVDGRAQTRAYVQRCRSHELPQAGTYDVITYHDVLEHLPDPLTELLQARRLLSHGGKIIVEVPDALPHRYIGRHHWKDEHVWYWSEEGVARMLNQVGFEASELGHFYRPIQGKQTIIASRRP